MTARTLSPLLLLAGLSLSFVLIASRPPETVDEEQATRVERSEPPVDSGRDIHAGYYALVRGGQMYAGTVLSATVTRSGPAWPGAPPREWGVFRFRVDRVVVGPEVREL